MTVKQFDRPTVRAILDECEEALRAVASRHGLVLERGGCSFRENECPTPFKLQTAADGDGKVAGVVEGDFRRMAPLLGLKPEDLGREFTSSTGKRFQICGAKPRNRKYPVLARCVETGKVYKFPESAVRVALGGTTS
jgi:hypothetical protein